MNNLLSLFAKQKKPMDIAAIRLTIASPEKIRSWSHGEVKKPETINYRIFKPERDGLFCAKIFGPVRDFECNCGKYKRMKHRGIVCEKCGVEVIPSKVRRDRLGHIDLATPVAHIWFTRSLPSRLATILDITLKALERVLYYESYIVMDPKDSGMARGELLNEEKYQSAIEEHGPDGFVAEMGAGAIRELLKEIDLEFLSANLRKRIGQSRSQKARTKHAKRLRVIEAFRRSGNRPEWMVLETIPVLSPDLRPLLPLDGGRFATTDLNDLYRRVINRNNRLKRLIELNAKEIIISNEKRMLQEAVDALFDNGKRGRVITGQNKQALKSLSDMIKGKEGRFRQNLLGKRVDYSGRSVIVVGPDLKLHQCGIPKKMALELFKPFIYRHLEDRGYVTTIKSAKKMVEQEKPEVWDALDEVIKEHPVILNRFPTLRRRNILSFEIVLTGDKAIRLNPLVCPAFNATFDGGQMNVHVPLSIEAQTEARILMMPENNVLSPSDGRPIILPTGEVVLGIFYLTKGKNAVKGEGMVLSCPEEVRVAYDSGCLSEHARIKVRIDKEIVETTTGRMLLREIVPDRIPFSFINKAVTAKDVERLVRYSYSKIGGKETVECLDNLVRLGLEFVTRSGLSIGIDDYKVPLWKDCVVEEAQQKTREIDDLFEDECITISERSMLTIETWEKASNVIKKEIGKTFNEENSSLNIISLMLQSGISGNLNKIHQIAGIRGVVANSVGERFEHAVTSNYKEGLSPLEYFMSTFSTVGKVRMQNNLVTHSGHLNRKFIYAVQNVIITEKDCGTGEGIAVTVEDGIEDRVVGRIAAEEVRDYYTGEIIVHRDREITEEMILKIKEVDVEKVIVRSVLTCLSEDGTCSKCYGSDLSTGRLVEMGSTVGIVAAQSIGGSTTQFILDARKGDKYPDLWLKEVIDLFEAREPGKKGLLSTLDGQIEEMDLVNGGLRFATINGTKVIKIPGGRKVIVREGDHVQAGDILTDGGIDPNELTRLIGIRGVQQFLLSTLQGLYRRESIFINDKHFEIIIKKMTEKVRIDEPGDTFFLKGDFVTRRDLLEENAAVSMGVEGGKKSISKPVLLGVSKAALDNSSFIAAAAFQETTKVLTGAALAGEVDNLKGLSENITIGRLIPAGTGLKKYRDVSF